MHHVRIELFILTCSDVSISSNLYRSHRKNTGNQGCGAGAGAGAVKYGGGGSGSEN